MAAVLHKSISIDFPQNLYGGRPQQARAAADWSKIHGSITYPLCSSSVCLWACLTQCWLQLCYICGAETNTVFGLSKCGTNWRRPNIKHGSVVLVMKEKGHTCNRRLDGDLPNPNVSAICALFCALSIEIAAKSLSKAVYRKGKWSQGSKPILDSQKTLDSTTGM